MQSTFQSSETGQAIIQNHTTISTEQLVISLHQGSDSSIEVQIKELVPDSGAIVSTMSINRDSMQKLVDWLREQDAIN
jgi:hypothetical protein